LTRLEQLLVSAELEKLAHEFRRVPLAAALNAGKRQPRLNWRFGRDKRVLFESGFRVYVSCCVHALCLLAPRRVSVEQSP
jgi:hypothetical protein